MDGALVGAGSLWPVGLICPFNQLILILVTVSAVVEFCLTAQGLATRVWSIPAARSPMGLPG